MKGEHDILAKIFFEENLNNKYLKKIEEISLIFTEKRLKKLIVNLKI